MGMRTIRMRAVLAILLTMITSNALATDELVIYSARNEQLIKPLFDAYTAATGTRSSSSPTRKDRFLRGSRPRAWIARRIC